MGYEADLCDEMSEAACMGDTYRRCERLGDGRLLWRTTDCAADADGNTRCDPAEGCLAPLDACEAQGSRCEGTIALDCVGSAVGRRFECARSGRTCVEDDSSIRCAVAPTGCAPCDGDVAQFCDGDIILSRSNCAATGLSCSPDGADGGGRCVAEQPVCDEGESRCDGPVAGICRRGLWFEFDCGRAGAQCALVGVGGEQQAVCE
jgi:hypothetical protein